MHLEKNNANIQERLKNPTSRDETVVQIQSVQDQIFRLKNIMDSMFNNNVNTARRKSNANYGNLVYD